MQNTNTVTMYLNTFENTFPKTKNHILKKNLANTVETMPNWLSIFMLLLKRSLHYQYHLFIKENIYVTVE